MDLFTIRSTTWRLGAVVSSLGLFGLASAGDLLPADLARAAKDYDRAQIQGDRIALDRLLSPDYKLVNGAAEVESKDQFIGESTEQGFKLDPFVVEDPVTIVWNDAAVLAGEVHLTGTSSGKPFDGHIRFSDVWAKQAGQWRVVFTQVTRFAPVSTNKGTAHPSKP